MNKEQATENFIKRGWIEIKPKDMENFYLVKNNMIRVPDAELTRYSPKEIALIGKVDLDELKLINDAKKIFKGMLIK